MYNIIESDNYKKLTYFFHENGLEITPGIERPDRVVKCWECTDPNTNKLIGAAALEIRADVFVVADVAVNKNYRNKNLGKELMKVVEEEIVELNGKEAWLIGKVPDYYLKLGWEVIAREDCPEITKCFTCKQYGVDCHPQVMRKTY